MKDKIIISLFCILSFVIGYSLSNFTYADNCSKLPAFHIIHLNKIIECVEINNNNQDLRIDALDTRLTIANDLMFNQIEQLEDRIDNQTRK